MRSTPETVVIGWREWICLPDLGIAAIKAKVDTGARTSAIHAFRIERFSEAGAPWARLFIHPLQKDSSTQVVATAAIIDERRITDSGGHSEIRVVINTTLDMADRRWPIEMTVTDRDSMLFRMLLGRTAIKQHAIVDPGRSYLLGRIPGRHRPAKKD